MKTYSRVKELIADIDDKAWCDNTYVICNQFGVIAIVYADNEQDALDSAMDNGKLDSELMNQADFDEYNGNGWFDSFMMLGNAGEPVWCEYLSIKQIR